MTLIRTGVEFYVTLAIIELSVKKLQPNTNSKLLILILFMTYSRGKASYYILRFCFFVLITTFSKSAFSQTCNNWLLISDNASFFRIGDLDIPGNQLTVEATFNRTSPWNGSDLYQGDLVSKHEGPVDCNYLLRPSSAEITTTNGYYKTPEICPIELNKTYHVAMVYDGRVLKFYRNGYLMSQINASGNLVLNDWLTQVGLYYNQVTQESFIGFINEVRIWNVARTQNEVRTYMKQPLQSPQRIAGLLAYYRFDNLNNKQGNSTWNGTLGGAASINQGNTNCTLIVDSCSTCSGSIAADFQYEQSLCSPNKVQFFTNLSNIQNYQWQFGDGSTGNSANPSVTYSNYNSFPVTLTVKSSSGCVSSITKTVSVKLQQSDIILNSDTTICFGDSLKLRTAVKDSRFCWKPVEGLSSPLSANPIVKPLGTGTYTLISLAKGTNLVKNADFSNGNASFNSDYTYSSSGIPPAVYAVGNNPTLWHPAMPSCGDHTTGSGSMMMVNGSEQQNTIVWSQSVSVTPNTNYSFSTWLETITTVNPAQLQFFINGVALGNVFSANLNSCIWDEFYSSWNSGSSTTATISIVNMNQGFSGNDFAIDDIFFGETSMQIDSVRITVRKLPNINLGNDTSICKGSVVQLKATTDNYNTIFWSPSTYLSNTAIANPIASPTHNMTYIAIARNIQGCIRKDTVTVKVLEQPTILLGKDTTVCKGVSVLLETKSTNTINYSWQPSKNLSNVASPAPLATPDSTTLYKVIASNGVCSATDSILLTIKQAPTLRTSNDTTICGTGKVQLVAAGALSYYWTPLTGLSDNTVANPIANPINTTVYTVLATGSNGCSSSDSVKVWLSPQPTIVLPKDSTICKGTPIVIKTNSTNAISYKWSPVAGLSDSTSSAPLATPNSTTRYRVVASNGLCSATDDILLSVKQLPLVSISKDTTICETSQVQLLATGGLSYLWIPKTGLSASNIANPVASPANSTTYTVLITGDNGCENSDSVNIGVIAKPIFKVTPAIQTICLKDSATLEATGGDIYTWKPSGLLASPATDVIRVSPLETTEYTVYIKNSFCNLEDSAVAVVNITPLPVISISKSNDIDCSNITSQLTVTGGSSYEWSPAAPLSSAHLYNPVASPTQTTTFSVIARSPEGCESQDSMTVKVANSGGNGIYIPTAFTPNGDGKNDCFGIKSIGRVDNFSLKIYNRWGENVFSTYNPMDCWNGSYKGIIQDTGAFIYYLKTKTFCGDVLKKGTITLIR